MMSEDAADKWNRRYASEDESIPPPSLVLSEAAHCLPERVSGDVLALDLACGRAGNALWLARRGYRVSAWDISEVVIKALAMREPQLIHECLVRDVTEHPPEPDTFDVVVVSRFLDRRLCPAISAALKPGGTLFYQTFTQGLSNPDYLLQPDELLSLFQGLDVLEYHDPPADETGKAEARLVARRPVELPREARR